MPILGFILLKGKDLALPDGASTAIIGLFFGMICGLFYYQHYYKSYYWFISLGGGLVLTMISQFFFMRHFTNDDDSSLRLTIAEFAIPFVLTLVLNHGLFLIKKYKRKKRGRRRGEGHSKETNFRFFDSPDAMDQQGAGSRFKQSAVAWEGFGRMRKLFFFSIAFLCVSCSTNAPIIVERMVISPDTVVFHSPDSITTVSITHTCTCPFTWTATVTPTAPWLVVGTNFPSSQSGDKSDVPLSINRSLLVSDTNSLTIQIQSNAYGDTSITVIAYH